MHKWICFLFLLPFTTHAQTQVLDPSGLLPHLRQFVAAPDFAHAFRCGDTALKNIDTVSCDYHEEPDGVFYGVCKSPSDGSSAMDMVYNCNADQVSILTDLTGDSVDISKTQFDFVHGDMAEIFLAQFAAIAPYDRAVITLTGLTATTFTLARGTPQERQVQAMNLIGTYGPPGGHQLDLLMTILPNVPAAAQIARLRVDNMTWFMLNDFALGTELK